MIAFKALNTSFSVNPNCWLYFFGGGCNDGEIIKIRKDRFLVDPRNSSH